MDKNKEKRISTELSRLKKISKKIDSDKREIFEGLLNRAAFMRIALEDLEKEINDKGTLDLFVQGEYKYFRESPALRSYNTTIKNYSLAIKQILNELPKNNKSETDIAELMDFIENK